ncbi:MAG: hypothetical protein HYX63_02035 [Gammaproteobacteria bacterium]|nr:hypothetical protein [Gammaproteobacteria bacterium]
MFVALLVSGSAWAERMSVEVIPLEHRLVRDVIPMLQPMLDPAGTLTGTASQLIVRTTRENLEQLKAVIAAIDTKIKQLKVSVTQDLNTVMQARQDALSGRLHGDDFTANVPDRGPAGAGDVTLETPAGGVRYQTTSTNTRENSNQVHFVVTMEGQPAFVETGEDLPSPYHNETVTPYGVGVSDGVDYQSIRSGIYVTPRLQGDRVVLDVAPQLERADPSSGAIESHRAATTVRGRLGEWLPLGGSNLSGGDASTELLARTRRQGDNSYSVWVKVEEQP